MAAPDLGNDLQLTIEGREIDGEDGRRFGRIDR
jgi:hypothetical protein